MKTHTLKKNSWHTWLAKQGGLSSWQYRDGVDICKYIRSVLKGAFIVSLVSVAAVWFLFGYLLGMYDVVVWAYNGAEDKLGFFGGFAMIINTIIVMIFAGFGLHCGAEKVRQYNLGKPKVEREPSFLTLAYRKFKDKTCFIVNFE